MSVPRLGRYLLQGVNKISTREQALVEARSHPAVPNHSPTSGSTILGTRTDQRASACDGCTTRRSPELGKRGRAYRNSRQHAGRVTEVVAQHSGFESTHAAGERQYHKNLFLFKSGNFGCDEERAKTTLFLLKRSIVVRRIAMQAVVKFPTSSIRLPRIPQ